MTRPDGQSTSCVCACDLNVTAGRGPPVHLQDASFYVWNMVDHPSSEPFLSLPALLVHVEAQIWSMVKPLKRR